MVLLPLPLLLVMVVTHGLGSRLTSAAAPDPGPSFTAAQAASALGAEGQSKAEGGRSGASGSSGGGEAGAACSSARALLAHVNAAAAARVLE